MVRFAGVSVMTRAAVIVMFAVPNLVPSSVEVAVTISTPDAGAVSGAVYTPAVVMAPYFADHVTALLKLPVPITVGVHWLVAVVCACSVVGAHDTLTDVMVGAAVIVTLAVPDLVASSVEVAVIVAEPDVGTVAGAV
jgi:hypothetical protein